MVETLVRREARLSVQRRAVAPSSYDADARTVELIATTSAPVKRWGWDGPYLEVLSFEPSAVDLGRVERGQCPLLDAHSRWSIKDQLGAIEGATLDGERLITPARFGDSEAAREAEAQVAAGTLRGVSIGYRISELVLQKIEDDVPVYLATKWELLEVSLCPVPADPDAGVRSAEGLHPCVIMETRSMKPEELNPAGAPASDQNRGAPAPAAPAPAGGPAAPDASAARMSPAEALDFAAQARDFGLEDAQARKWATELTPDAARSALLSAAAEKQRAAAPLQPAMSTIRISQDERDTARDAMTSALMHRFNPKNELSDAGREYRGMSLLEMARSNLEANGEKVRGLGRRELADMALRQHSTSDFPYVLSSVSYKALRGGYEAAPQTFKAWQRRASVPDFKQVTRLQLGGAPSFLLVPEGGEFKMGTIGEAKEVYAIATYGRRFSITRQVLINDDVDAFTRIPQMWGRAAADFESDAAYAPLIANPNMGDGNALFSTAHGNLAASGAALSETTLQLAEIAMQTQTGIEGRYINVQPKYLLVAPKDKVAAQKLLTGVTAATTSNVNVYAGALDLVVEPRLSRSSGAVPYFLAADSAQVDTIEYAYLEGDDGVFLDERMGFEVDGIEYKARLDFGVKAIDWRGLYENASA